MKQIRPIWNVNWLRHLKFPARNGTQASPGNWTFYPLRAEIEKCFSCGLMSPGFLSDLWYWWRWEGQQETSSPDSGSSKIQIHFIISLSCYPGQQMCYQIVLLSSQHFLNNFPNFFQWRLRVFINWMIHEMLPECDHSPQSTVTSSASLTSLDLPWSTIGPPPLLPPFK